MADTRRVVHIECRLRPTRFGFVCVSESMQELREAIATNTVLWGGYFNPIIPFFRRRPKWAPASMRGIDITKGYIEGFQPDYLIVPDGARAERLGWAGRTVASAALLDRRGTDRHVFGTDVLGLYQHLYETRFGFRRRQEIKATLPVAPSSRLAPLIAAAFGGFSPELEHYESAYRKVFSPEEVTITPQNIFSGLLSLTPIIAGSLELRVLSGRARGLPGVVLFIADPTRPTDVIDFWNLRTLDVDIFPVPLPWIWEMTPSFEWLLDRIQSGPGQDHRPNLIIMSGRSVPNHFAEELAARLRAMAAGSTDVYVCHYPRLWDRWGREADNFMIAEVTAEQAEYDVEVSGRDVTLTFLTPTFAKNSVQFGTALWVNVFQLRNFGGDPHFPEVLVPDLRDVGDLFGPIGLDEIWPSFEGLVIPADGGLSKKWVRIPTGEEVLSALFNRFGYVASASDPGIVAHQLANRLGYRHTVSILANLHLLRLLDRMSKGCRAPRKRMLEGLKLVHDRSAASPANRLERLVQAGVLRVGLEVQCNVCNWNNWVDLKDLSQTLTCDRCLETYSFPVAHPPTKWKYRVAGPLSVPGYARGAYSVLLAVRFFQSLARLGGLTWAPSMNLTKGNDSLEIDFAILINRRGFGHAWPRLLIGEAKSEGRFQERDIVRLRKLARALPEVAIVVATLRDELSAPERRLLLPLAKAGWAIGRPRRVRSPLIVLTGKELLLPRPDAWLYGGDGRRVLEGPDWLWDLAAYTQRDNLGFDAYAAVDEQKLAKTNA